MIYILKNKTTDFFLIFFIGLSFLYGVLSYQHYTPSSHDFYINNVVFFLCSLGLLIFFFKNKILNVKLNSFFWGVLFLIFLFQPFINKIIYVDGLIFPLAEILFIIFLSIAISNIKEKNKFIKNICLIFVLAGFFLFLTQIVHVFKVNFLLDIMRLPLQNQRFSGNLFQPNQTAFVLVLSVISIMFLIAEESKSIVLKYIFILFLSIGVSFTASRAGLIMLICFTFLFNIFINYFENKSLFILKDLFFSILGTIIGIVSYPYFSKSSSIIGRASESLEDVRWSLLYQTALIISDYPITGVGWKNFAGTGLEYYEKLSWLGLTDHSHFIFGQILAEFGLLGLGFILLFLYIFIKNLFLIRNKVDAYILVVLLIFIFYSCFEYPLWYFRYLVYFSIFLAFFDKSELIIYTIKKGYLITFILFVFLFSSIYYGYQYQKIAYISDVVFDSNVSDKKRFEKLSTINPVFGFSYFNDLLLYQSISTDGFLLKDSIEIGERLVNYIPLNQYLIKQGTLVGLDGQEKKALKYFEASCHYHKGKECKNTKLYLKELSIKYPKNFDGIYKKIDSDFSKNDI